MYGEKPPDDRQRNCPKHVEFYSKNKFEELMHLVGFIIRIYHDARSPESRKKKLSYSQFLSRYSSRPAFLEARDEQSIFFFVQEITSSSDSTR